MPAKSATLVSILNWFSLKELYGTDCNVATDGAGYTQRWKCSKNPSYIFTVWSHVLRTLWLIGLQKLQRRGEAADMCRAPVDQFYVLSADQLLSYMTRLSSRLGPVVTLLSSSDVTLPPILQDRNVYIVRSAASARALVCVCPMVCVADCRTDRRLDPPPMSRERNNAFRPSSTDRSTGPQGSGVATSHTDRAVVIGTLSVVALAATVAAMRWPCAPPAGRPPTGSHTIPFY